MQKLRVALIGVGDVATRDYLPEWERVAQRAVLVAMCGRAPERVGRVAAQFNVSAYTDVAAMLVEAEADAVVNLTPVQQHDAINLAVLLAGKHVYSEKTVAATLVGGERLRAAAEARGLVVICAPCVLLWPQFRQALHLVRSGVIGDIYAAHASIPGSAPPWEGYSSDPSHFFAAGGGPLKDMGIYALHALTGIFGPARRVSAFASRTRTGFTPTDGPATGKTIPIEVDDNWQLLLDHGDGRLASLTVNFCSTWVSRAPQLELLGTHGSLGFNLIDVAAPLLLHRANAGTWEKTAVPPTGRASGPDHILGVAHLLDCVLDGQTPVLSIDHALHALEIIERAEQSAATGQSMNIASTFTLQA